MIEKFQKLRNYILKASPHKNFPRQVVDLLAHKILININPKDYYSFEFYKDGKSWDEKSRYVAIGGSIYWPYENNEFKYTTTLSNKYIQKTLLIGFELPTPRLIATVGAAYRIRTQEQFNALLDGIDGAVVLKPISSAGGENIFVLSGKGPSYVVGGTVYTRDEIWNQVGKLFDVGWLIEECIQNTPDIKAIHPPSLNTHRVITIKTNDNKWHVATCALKFGTGGSVADNIGAGGIRLPLDNKGRSFRAFDENRWELITHHPDTGVPLNDIIFSGYQEVMKLALVASEKFGFLGTIGWDIAYTEKGACIIEGNTLWGDNIQRSLGKGLITDEIAKGLRRHGLFSRWDKSRMYPGYNK